MWCKNGRQDVPGVLSQNDKQFCCVRCGQLLAVAADAPAPPADSPAGLLEDQVAAPERTHYDPWEMNEKLRHAERVLQLGRRLGPGLDEPIRFDPAIP